MAHSEDGGEASLPADRGEGAAATPERRAEFQRRAREQLLFDLATVDLSLGCFNRAYLVHRAREEVARRRRYGQRLSVLLLEADRRLPGACEPEARERLLRAIVAVATPTLRPTDILARWQAAEVLILLPGTGLAGATRMARRLCAALRSSAPDRAVGTLAASVGLATALGRAEPLDLLVQRARAGLMEARAGGLGRLGIG
jgi:diguanylate cyclase (GGDEF)-like protein